MKGKLIKLSNFQIKQISKYWFDLSKLTFASLILKLFEPGGSRLNLISLGTLFWGIVLTGIFVGLGIEYSRKVTTK